MLYMLSLDITYVRFHINRTFILCFYRFSQFSPNFSADSFLGRHSLRVQWPKCTKAEMYQKLKTACCSSISKRRRHKDDVDRKFNIASKFRIFAISLVKITEQIDQMFERIFLVRLKPNYWGRMLREFGEKSKITKLSTNATTVRPALNIT